VCLKVFLFSLFFSFSVFASQISLDGRFEVQNTQRDLSHLTAIYESNPLLGLNFQGLARLSTSLKDLETLGYGASASLPLFSVFEFSTRISNENWLNSTTSLSHLLFLAQLRFNLFSVLELFFSGGWYKRFVKLNKPYLLPNLVGADFTEHDFAVALGTQIFWTPRLTTLFKVSTFEDLSVYNLNNPYIQAQLFYQPSPEGGTWMVYSRYKLLLGFGRLDSLSVGLGTKIPLS
jgi:hypothetical protein